MTDAQGQVPEADSVRKAIRRAALLTAGAGIAYGVLVIVAWFLMAGERDALREAADPTAQHSTTALGEASLASMYLLPFAAILFLWFIVALRGWIRSTRHRPNMLISDLQLVSGVAFTVVFLVSAAAAATSVIVAGWRGEEIPVYALRGMADFGSTLMIIMGVRMAAVFVLATASLGMTTGALPRWFNFVSYGFGLVLVLAPVVEETFAMAFPVWVIVLSVMLLHHLANLPADEVPGFASRYTQRNETDAEGAGIVD